MTIKVGDRLPDGKLMESTEFDSATQCAMAPKEVNVADAAKGKKSADKFLHAHRFIGQHPMRKYHSENRYRRLKHSGEAGGDMQFAPKQQTIIDGKHEHTGQSE